MDAMKRGRLSRSGVQALHALVCGGALVGLGCSGLDAESDTAALLFGDGNVDDGPLPPEWACLEQPLKLADQEPQRIKYVVGIVDFDSQPLKPIRVPNLNIEVCGSPSCDPPASAPDVVVINPVPGLADYVYMIEFPYRFSNGSLRLTAPDYAPMDYFFNGPLVGPPEGGYQLQGLTIPLLKATTRDTIYHDLGLPGDADTNRGVLAIRTLNCLRPPETMVRAPGVLLESVPNAPKAPAVAWSLSTSNRATANRLETDSRGVAGFVNVQPLVYDVQGIAPVGSGRPYGFTSLPVRAGVITLAEVRDGIGVWGQ